MTRRSEAIGRTVVLQVAVRVVAMLASILTVSIATRYLGLGQYGLLSTAVVFVTLFTSFTELGVGPVIIRRVANGRGALGSLVGLNLGFSLVFAPVVGIVTAVVGMVVYRHEPTVQLAIVILSLGLVLTTVTSCWEPIYEVTLRYGAVAFADGASRILTLGAAWAVAALDGGLLAMAAVQVVPPVVRLLVTVVTAPRIERSRPVLIPAATLDLLRESLPITLLVVVGVLYTRVDGLILSILSVPEDVAVYGVAMALVTALSFFPAIFCKAVYPTLAERYASDPDGFRRSLQSSYQVMLVIAAPIAVLGWFVAGQVLTIVSTPEFAERGTVALQLMLVAGAVTFLNALLTQPLFASGEQRFLTWISPYGLVVNIVLNIVLVPLFGVVGTGVALVVTEVQGTILTTWKLRRMGHPPLRPRFLLRLAPGLVLAAALMALLSDAPFVVTVATGGIAYCVSVFVTGALPLQVVTELLRNRRRAAAES